MQKLSNQILDLRKLEKLSTNLCKDISVGDIYLFQGELGAGKTTFVDGLKTISRENKSIGTPVIYYISFDEVYNLNDQDVFNANIWRASRQKVVEKVKYLIHLFH